MEQDTIIKEVEEINEIIHRLFIIARTLEQMEYEGEEAKEHSSDVLAMKKAVVLLDHFKNQLKNAIQEKP